VPQGGNNLLHVALEVGSSKALIHKILAVCGGGNHLISEPNKDLYLPLHSAAAYGAPLGIVQELIRMHPEATRATSRDQKLPLHLALSLRAPESSVLAILDSWPNATRIRVQDTPADETLAADAWGRQEAWPTGKRLPLHLAVIANASLAVIEKLIEAYPESAQDYDAHGVLPLHHATQFASDAVIMHILAAYPLACQKRTRNQDYRLPLHLSLNFRNSDHVVLELLRAFPGACKLKAPYGWLPLHIAAYYGASDAVLTALADSYSHATFVRTEDRTQAGFDAIAVTPIQLAQMQQLERVQMTLETIEKCYNLIRMQENPRLGIEMEIDFWGMKRRHCW
jgi:hypothetical protein